MKRWEEGTRIHTSSLVTDTANLKEGQRVETLNTIYELGVAYKELN